MGVVALAEVMDHLCRFGLHRSLAGVGGLPVEQGEWRALAKMPLDDASCETSTRHYWVQGTAQEVDRGAHLRLVRQVQTPF